MHQGYVTAVIRKKLTATIRVLRSNRMTMQTEVVEINRETVI
jgi:hypothetical protein